jgi:hypothetical protein
MSFKQYILFHEMSHALLPRKVSVSGMDMPCPGKIAIDSIDMRFEDYEEGRRFLPDEPFWAILPGSDVYLVYHGRETPFGSSKTNLMNAMTAASYIEKYEAAPRNWWKWAEGLSGNERLKLAFKLRDGEKASQNGCEHEPAAVVQQHAY